MKEFSRFNDQVNRMLYENKSKSINSSERSAGGASPRGSPIKFSNLSRLNSSDSLTEQRASVSAIKKPPAASVADAIQLGKN